MTNSETKHERNTTMNDTISTTKPQQQQQAVQNATTTDTPKSQERSKSTVTIDLSLIHI